MKGCTAAIVAAAPIEGTLLKDCNVTEGMNSVEAREAFLKSDEYGEVAKVLPFCRLWCVRADRHLSSCPHPSATPTTRPARQPHAHAHPPTY